MVRIIKRGSVDFVETCRNCSCVYAYQLSDVYHGSTECPECKEENVHCAYTLEEYKKEQVLLKEAQLR